MEPVRQNTFIRMLWVLVAALILNFSVDAPDGLPDYVPEDLSYNDMESVLEVVLEAGFCIENVIAEHDEHDADECGTYKKEIVYSCQTLFSGYNNSFRNLFYGGADAGFPAGFGNQYFPQYRPEIVPPPPKA